MPWTAGPALCFDPNLYMANIYDKQEAVAYVCGRTRDEAIKRAAIVASSPEMLEVLKSIERSSGTCPECRAEKPGGHADNCLLGGILRDIEQAGSRKEDP